MTIKKLRWIHKHDPSPTSNIEYESIDDSEGNLLKNKKKKKVKAKTPFL